MPLALVEIGDKMHTIHPDGSFTVDEKQDGQNTQQHIDGIAYITGVLQRGQKIMPVLLRENDDGTYSQLDGFKRLMAQRGLGYKYVEAFCVTPKEYEGAVFFDYGNGKMRAWHGGQEKEQYGLFEGGERENFKYDETKFLFKSPDGAGLRIEVSECIHVHWGAAGKYRLALGRKDFEALAEAVSKIE